MKNNYIVKLSNITKTFPGVKALDDVSFDLKAGEVLALLGENGAGKSTLMKILSGVYTRDDGKMEIFGKAYGDLTPSLAASLGIAIIHQELNMCAHLTVAQNIFLGREASRLGILSEKRMIDDAKKILASLNIDINPMTIIGDLPVSKQQMVEIAKALSQNAKILIMDEPTSSLTSKEIDDLFKIIKKLKDDGCGIVYISHRLEELKYIVDRVMIMRDGKYITSADFCDISMEEMIVHMVGREIKEKYPNVSCERGKKILEIKNFTTLSGVKDVSLDVFEGEILGIAGLMGAGRTELTRAIFSADLRESGKIFLDDKEVKISSPVDAIKNGIFLVPEDRKRDGLCVRLCVRDNISLPNMELLCNIFGVVNKRKERKVSEKAVNDLRIKFANMEVDVATLSGGNQQKVVVAKWLVGKSRVIIFDEPTRGIDVAAKVEIYNLMNELKSQGIGVVFVSSELPEILGMSDRIAVMCDGKVTGELSKSEATQEKILTYATMFDDKKDSKMVS